MSKCFCFPWHPNLSCAPHHAFLLLSPEKDFMVPLVECQERWHFPVKMCREIFYWRSIKKILGGAAGEKKQFCLILTAFFFFFFDSQKSYLDLQGFWRNSVKKQKWHTSCEKYLYPLHQNMLLMQQEFEGSYLWAGWVNPEIGSSGKLVVIVTGWVTFHFSLCSRLKCQFLRALSSPAWLCIGTAIGK